MARLVKNNGAYVEENFNYMYIFDESMHTVKHVWTSEYSSPSLTFPQIDYTPEELKVASSIKDCKKLLEDSGNNSLIRRKQKKIVETLAQGKTVLGVGAFSSATQREGVVLSPIYLTITGNASIKFSPSSFGKANVELILPKDMLLYKVMDRDSRSGVCSGERYLIASKIINPQNLDYSDEMIDSVFDTLRIIPITHIQSKDFSLIVDDEHYYSREDGTVHDYMTDIRNSSHADGSTM